MCHVDSSVTVDIDSRDFNPAEYYCNECKNKFKGLGNKIRCPSCMSANVKKV